jgi:serine/threonine protein kinase/tetratricopeptide (TPR) repeat protein
MNPERDNYQALIESLADGVEVDWSALDSAATTDAERRRYRNLRLVARVAELHRTLVLDDENGAASASPVADKAPADDPTTWGHLSVHARLAAGAFGRIYRAHDPQLNREVALKLLHGDILAFGPIDHLLAEARTLAKVHHPNVVTVYGADVRDGRAGLWMELVDGQTLEAWLRTHGAMGSGEASAAGVDLCRALAAVHGAGLVHGDVKAQNVMREQGGRIVLMDFGAGRVQGADATGVAGTPMYLAPEVLAGEPPTPRSDLYSLGVLLFHLMTAAYPYTGEDLDGLRASHADGRRTWLRDLRPDLPDRLVQSIERAIDADPARRFATAGAMERALREALEPPAVDARAPEVRRSRRWQFQPAFAAAAAVLVALTLGLIVWSGRVPGAGGAAIKSLAVLPLVAQSGSSSSEFTDAMTEQLIATIGEIDSLRTTSLNSTLPFKGDTRTPTEIASLLGVDAVLKGVLYVADGGAGPGHVRLDASLIAAGTGATLWTGSFEGQRGDMTSLLAKAAGALARAVNAKVTGAESLRLRQVRSTTPAAEEAYLQGRLHLSHYGPEPARRALESFQRALLIDPKHAAAHAGAALAYVTLGDANVLSHADARLSARAEIRKAFESGEEIAEAYAAQADIEFLYDWDWDGAVRDYRRSLDLNPGFVHARDHYAQVLAASRRFDEAVKLSEETLQIDPQSGEALISHGMLLYYKKDYQGAEAVSRRIVAQEPENPAGYILGGRVAEAQLRYADALDMMRQALTLTPAAPVNLRVLVIRLQALAGQHEEAREAAAELERAAAVGALRVRPRELAYLNLGLGRIEAALDGFQAALRERDPAMVWLTVDPRVDILRSQPRFQAILKELGLP